MGHLVQTSCQSRVTYSRLHRTLSRRVLNISREEDSTTSLGSLFQGSVTLRVKKFFLMFRWNFLVLARCLARVWWRSTVRAIPGQTGELVGYHHPHSVWCENNIDGCKWFCASWLYGQSTALGVHHFIATERLRDHGTV